MNHDQPLPDAGEPLPPPPPLSIIALDDDADFRQYISTMLEGEGHDVRAVDAPDALHQSLAERLPDIVLLDIKMGRHSGEEVLADIRKRWPRLAVVVVTGYPSLDSMRQTFKQDVFDYLAKPFSMADLRRVLAQAAASLDLGRRPQDVLRREVGRAIRVARADRGWTLKDLSEKSGVSISQLSSIERGTHLPSLDSLLSISEALGARPSEWLAAAGL